MFIKLPDVQSVSLYLHHCNDCTFTDYNEMLFASDGRSRFPTGTCMPFTKKVFVTVKGKILACERIGHQYILGSVDSNCLDIDFQKISEQYNQYYDKIRRQCGKCYNVDNCIQCIFYLDINNRNPTCKGFMNYKDYSRYLSYYIDYIEERPGMYSKILNQVVFD